MNNNNVDLKILSAQIRVDILNTLVDLGYGHLGGSMSIVELLSVLYGKQMKYDISNPHDSNRDMLVLSKGHAGIALYSALANVGFFDRKLLKTMNNSHTNLPSHPDRLKTIGVDVTTGSLGQGVSIAAGIATALKKHNENRFVYLIVGDGELNEGQCWEGFQYIASYNLSRCIVFIDENKKQLDGMTNDIIKPFDICKKMEAFGFYTQYVDGKDESAIDGAINNAKNNKLSANCIILDTIKGQGSEFFEKYEQNHAVKLNDIIKIATLEEISILNNFIGGN